MRGHTGTVENSPINSVLSSAPRTRAGWRDLVVPKEHGSWSLALEPLALGLLVAPSRAGAALGLAVVAAFFARRPLKIAALDARAERRIAARRPLGICVIFAALSFAGAMVLGGTAWLPWLLPSAVAGAGFLWFDLRNAGREEMAEIAGSAAFAFVPAAIATLAGWRAPEALALALVMTGRSVPTVILVRASLRAAKTGVRHFGPALLAAGVALIVGVSLAVASLVPLMVAGLLGLLAGRAATLGLWRRYRLRARILGMIEAAIGVGFVVIAAWAWRS